MKSSFTLLNLATLILFGASSCAWAEKYPDFEDDGKPILRMQPGLVQYVENTFKVRDTGLAHIPGTDKNSPQPPFWFEAKPIGYDGPYYLTLRIQPGPPGHILQVIPRPLSKVVQASPHPTTPTPAAAPAPAPVTTNAPAPAPVTTASGPLVTPAPTPAFNPPHLPPVTNAAPDANTPSGPLAPPPDQPTPKP